MVDIGNFFLEAGDLCRVNLYFLIFIVKKEFDLLRIGVHFFNKGLLLREFLLPEFELLSPAFEAN
jgi:hypothetical protein